jgi:hypothetical protein
VKKRELYSRKQNYECHTYDTQKFIELRFAETIMDLCGCITQQRNEKGFEAIIARLVYALG